MPFDTRSTANLSPLAFLKKNQVLSENPSIFSKKTQILNVLRNISVSVAFYGTFATIWLKNFTFRNVNKLADVT